jgi:hypothetical protein
MGMSASDAAPLPRLGEAFFDVRGSSRSMRLSWYSNTGIAVFSIWQGGTCTGTFRMSVDDVSRLADSLRRGGLADSSAGSEAGEPGALGGGPRLASDGMPAEPFTGAMTALPDEQVAAYRYGTGGYRTGGQSAGGHGADGHGPGGYGADGPAAEEYSADTYSADTYRADTYSTDAYGADGRNPGGYPAAGYGSGAGTGAYSSAAYPAGGYGQPAGGFPAADRDAGGQADHGYGQERYAGQYAGAGQQAGDPE